MATLFKFISDPGAVPYLLRGQLKFTPISELNDPSELVPEVDPEAVRASLQRYRRDGYTAQDITFLKRQALLLQKLAPKLMAAAPPSTPAEATNRLRHPAYDNIDRLADYIEEIAEEMAARVGVFCLTQAPDSLSMWAHYAATATGVLVEFKDLDKDFPGDETATLGQPIPVRYTRETETMTFDPSTYDTLFFTKLADWDSEQEVRIVLPLADCEARRIGDSNLYIRDVGPGRVAKLHLGWRMSEEVAQQVVESAMRIDPTVEVRRYVPSRLRRRLSTK